MLLAMLLPLLLLLDGKASEAFSQQQPWKLSRISRNQQLHRRRPSPPHHCCPILDDNKKRHGRRRCHHHRRRPTLLLYESLSDNNIKGDDDDNNRSDSDSSTDLDLDRWNPLTPIEKVQLPIQLALSIYLLLLVPSGLANRTICGAKYMSTIPYEYLTFFSLLVIPRSYRFGKFAKVVVKNKTAATKKDKDNKGQHQRRSTSIQSLLCFIMSLIGSHWYATYQFAMKKVNGGSNTTLLLLFAPKTCQFIRLLAIGLVGWSGWTLGKSYDRVAKPDQLVMSGPYSKIRHPIYTAYLLLFGSTLISLRAFGACVLMMITALYFYWGRMKSEEQILEECFGEEYVNYKETKAKWRLVPFLL